MQVAGGRVANAGALFVRNTDGEVALMPTKPARRTALAFRFRSSTSSATWCRPTRRRPRPGSPIGDLDGDGSVEAVVAAPGLGLVVLPGLAAAADPKISPEHPPTINGFKLATGAQPREVVVTDVDGDGRADVAALDGDTPTLRTFLTHSQKPLDIQPAKTVTLPALRASLRATGCAATPLIVTLADGRIFTVSRAGKVEPILDAMVPVASPRLVGRRARGRQPAPPGLSLFDSCADGGALLGLSIP